MSLRSRIMILVAMGMVLATVPLGVAGIGMLRAATDRILEERLAMARATAEHLDHLLTQGWRQLDYVGRRVVIVGEVGDPARVPAVLAAAPQTPLFSGIFFADARGRLVAMEPAAGDLRPPSPLVLRSVREALTSGRRATTGLLRTESGVPVVIFLVPAIGPTGAVVGIVGGIVNLTSPTLHSFIAGLAVGTSGHAAIVSADGTVLASTDSSELFTRNEHPEFFARLIAERRALVGPTAEQHGSSNREERHIMAGAPVPTAQWGLALGQNEEETFGPVRRLRGLVILFEVLVLMAALLFAWLDTGAVAAPLRLLKEAAEGIAAGDLQRRIDVRRADEIGALARSFETMQAQLLRSLEEIQRRSRAFQSLFEIGTEVLSLQDRDAVLQSVAVRTVSLLQADVACVCLLDDSGKTARVSASAGAAGAVLQHQHPVSVAPGDVALGVLDCPNLAKQYRTAHLASPLTIGGRTVGALCAGTQTTRTFSTEDREVLRGLANLAAIAVENARLQERVQSVAVLEERERIAREMHDGVGQVLGYVNTKAQALKALLDSEKIAEARAQLAQLEQAARELYADLREAILGLRTTTLSDRGLMPALQEYVRRFSELSGVVTALTVEGDPSRYVLSPTSELHLIRIIQEALTNVRKHSMARRAWVRFAERDEVVTIAVEDDGLGFDPTRLQAGVWPKFGLQMMRERAEVIGGTLSIRSRDGSGTEVLVRLPLQQGRMVDARPAGG
ncbi:MAG: HAMP domain-containing protein [Armatimonadetes bacterium]|nr:HAMP domain-containing protein [Armatimonadota bacterium]